MRLGFGETRAFRAVATALACVLAATCVARRPPLDPSLAGRAEALVREGCYDCLLDARDIYERLMADGRVAAAATRIFEVNLLLALREKELALDPAGAIGRARTLAPRLPAAVDATRYVEVVEI